LYNHLRHGCCSGWKGDGRQQLTLLLVANQVVSGVLLARLFGPECVRTRRAAERFTCLLNLLLIPSSVLFTKSTTLYTMHLLDLPLELLHEILGWAILVRGTKRGLRLRLVNSRLPSDILCAGTSANERL